MSLLGEISKNSEALRYHARTAEIAGQNLAHVNDENYARQRVLAKEGVMYNAHGCLQTSGLEGGGLDHARSKLLDNRVIVEVGETSAMEAKQEILQLLQAAMGETLTNSSVNAGLDEDHESILAPGSLSRALNDFFNSFHELSVAPNDATTKQEILNKIQTLVSRFNETGANLDQIEVDLTNTMSRSIDQVNSLLEKLHEVNTQIRRFELQENGKAVVYRDRRQALLEELSTYMNFSFEDDIDQNTGKSSGFLNLFIDAKDGRKVNLLDPSGPKTLTNEWGQNITIGESLFEKDLVLQGQTDPQLIATAKAAEKAKLNPGGKDAVVRALVGADGKLGKVEVVDGGNLYDDSDAPLLITFLPPKPVLEDGDVENLVDPVVVGEGDEANPAGQPVDFGNDLAAVTGGATQLNDLANATLENSARTEGDIFYYAKPDGTLGLWQALENTIAGIDPNENDQFMEITDWPNGKVDETRRKFSDIENFSKGDQIYYEGKYYQALEDSGPVVDQSIDAAGVALTESSRNFAARDVFKFGDNYFQALSDLPKGIDFTFDENIAVGDVVTLNLDDTSAISGKVLFLGAELPTNDPDADQSRTFPLQDGDQIQKGDLFNSNGSYFMSVSDIGILDQNNPLHTKFITDFNPESSSDFVKINAKVDSTVETLDLAGNELNLNIGQIYFHNDRHFLVQDAPYDTQTSSYSFQFDTAEEVAAFDPFDDQWSDYIVEFNAQLLNGDPTKIIRNDAPIGHNTSYGAWKELNLGIAEAVIKGGEIVDFKIVNEGDGLPSDSSIFLDNQNTGEATELLLKSGAIAGYQDAKLNAMDKYRKSLNSLVSDFVKQVNEIYNPTDEPGGYLFGFDAFLTRPVRGPNTFIEETYGLFGKEGNGELKLFDEEVAMTVPYAENETFSIVQSTNILPKELEQGWDLEDAGIAWFRDGDNFGLQIEDVGVQSNFYASARRMQHTTIDFDPTYPGEDKILTPSNPDNDDGRFLLRGYESIPFRIEDGSDMYVQGDNFSFDAVVSNEWNLASALRVDNDLSIENIKSSDELAEGANDVAFEISKLGDGDFTEAISVMNADLGNEMGDLADNLEHQKSLESLLLDQRRAVSSVSIDEEVADLMQFQRSFQASSRVLNTLDRMLELVVMGLIK